MRHALNKLYKRRKIKPTEKRWSEKGEKKAVQVFFCFYFNTAKGMIIDVLGPKIVGLLIGLGLF